MVTVRFPSTRLLVAGGCAAAIAAAPMIAIAMGGMAASAPAARTVADCTGGGISANLYQAGTPVGGSCTSTPFGSGGGAPSEGLLSTCANVPGCLSQALYGPGNVQVPNVDTTVHQSQ